MRGYKGPAFAFDARVVCVQPNFISMDSCQPDDETEANEMKICGKVVPRHSVENAILNSNGTEFECKLPISMFPSCWKPQVRSLPECSRKFQWTVCILPSAAGGLIPALDPTNNASLRHTWFQDQEIWLAGNGKITWPVDLGSAYLILNATNDGLLL